MIPYELSVVLGGHIVRSRFLAEKEVVERLLHRVHSQVQNEMLKAKDLSVNEFQILRLDGEERGTAKGWVETVASALYIQLNQPAEEGEEESLALWQALMAQAQAIDASLNDSDAVPQFMVGEFVWDNGGGDDNVFSQGFWTNANASSLFGEFLDTLETIEQTDAPFYDMGWEGGRAIDAGLSLGQLREALQPLQKQLPTLVDAVSSLHSYERNQALEESLPQPTPARRSGPRF